MFGNMNRRERMALIFLAFFAVGVLYYFLVYLSMMDSISALEGRKDTLNQQIKVQMATLSKMPKLEKKYEGLKYIENVDQTDRISSIDEMLTVLSDEAEKSGFTITSFQPQAKNEDDNITKVNMDANGTFSEFVLFLKGIKELDGEIEFKEIGISRQDNTNKLTVSGVFIFHYDLFYGGDKT